MKYATDLGIVIQEDMSKADLSAVLDRVLRAPDPKHPLPGAPYGLLLYAQSIGLQPSPYIDYEHCIGEITYKLNGADLCAFYIYAVQMSRLGTSLSQPTSHPQWPLFQKLGDDMVNDERAYKSLCTRLPEDYINPSHNTLCYKAAAALMQGIK